MAFAGKLIGGFLGFLINPFLGTAIGLWIGHQFDRAVKMSWSPMHFANLGGNASPAQHAFFNATFSVMGHIAKADGRVSPAEIKLAETLMTRMRLSPEQRQEAMTLFNTGKQADFDLAATLQQLRQASGGNIVLLRLFLELQHQAANVDGISADKQQLLEKIAQALGTSTFYSSGFGSQGFAGFGQQQAHRASSNHVDDPYAVLDIQSNASDGEVKKAYRRLMSQNHPDKLASQGLTEEMIKLATEKNPKHTSRL